MAHFLIQSPVPSRNYEVLSFSWRGSGHRAKEEPKQDFCGHRDLGALGVLAVVSDGVGSCPRSREGAESVVGTTLDTLSEGLRQGISTMEASGFHWKAWIATSVVRNRLRLAGMLKESDPEYPDERKVRELFSATQLVIWTDGRHCVASVVGDGAIIGVKRLPNGDLDFEELVEVERAGFANEVVPVTHPDWERGWLFQGPEECSSFEGIMVMTDGFSDTAGEGFYPYLWEQLKQCAGTPREISEVSASTCPGPGASAGSLPPPLPQTENSDREQRSEFLEGLSRKLEADRVSADDKTLVAIRFL